MAASLPFAPLSRLGDAPWALLTPGSLGNHFPKYLQTVPAQYWEGSQGLGSGHAKEDEESTT